MGALGANILQRTALLGCANQPRRGGLCCFVCLSLRFMFSSSVFCFSFSASVGEPGIWLVSVWGCVHEKEGVWVGFSYILWLCAWCGGLGIRITAPTRQLLLRRTQSQTRRTALALDLHTAPAAPKQFFVLFYCGNSWFFILHEPKQDGRQHSGLQQQPASSPALLEVAEHEPRKNLAASHHALPARRGIPC